MDALTARNTIARHIISEFAREGFGKLISWEDFPEVGEYDWNHIVAETLLIAVNFRPPVANVTEAVKFLKERADQEV